MREEAIRIFEKYCVENSTSEANISGESRRRLRQVLLGGDVTDVSSSVFNNAKAQFLHLHF